MIAYGMKLPVPAVCRFLCSHCLCLFFFFTFHSGPRLWWPGVYPRMEWRDPCWRIWTSSQTGFSSWHSGKFWIPVTSRRLGPFPWVDFSQSDRERAVLSEFKMWVGPGTFQQPFTFIRNILMDSTADPILFDQLSSFVYLLLLTNCFCGSILQPSSGVFRENQKPQIWNSTKTGSLGGQVSNKWV